jgi:transposase
VWAEASIEALTKAIERLGRHRWVVERTFSWLLGFRRLGMRYERRADLLQGLLDLACALSCLHWLTPTHA